MKKEKKYIDRVYKLTDNMTPLSYNLPVRHTRRYSLLHFDEEMGANRPLRYASNQKSPFEDEQDGMAIVDHVIFENGFLHVPANNQVLQHFLALHPMNGITFVEVDAEADAEKELKSLTVEADALVAAMELSVDQLETVARVLFGKDPSTMTTKELKRDILVFAKTSPSAFLEMLKDPLLEFQSNVQRFFDSGLLTLRNNGKEVWFNTSTNKKKMMSVPFGANATEEVALYLKSDEGLDALKMLEISLNL